MAREILEHIFNEDGSEVKIIKATPKSGGDAYIVKHEYDNAVEKNLIATYKWIGDVNAFNLSEDINWVKQNG
jgi:hypothetical protein